MMKYDIWFDPEDIRFLPDEPSVEWNYIKWIGLAIILTPIVSFLVYVFVVPHANAKERTYSGVIKDGQIYTLSEICHGS